MLARRLQITGAAVLLMAATLSMTAPTVAAQSAQVPFRATITGVGGFSGPSSVSFVGSGTAWHLGAITDDGAATDFTPATDCPQGGINDLHAETFTASDGSTLSVLGQDVTCWLSHTLLHCTSCPWFVTGGTGRFAEARGTGDLDGYLDLTTGTFFGTYTGTISF